MSKSFKKIFLILFGVTVACVSASFAVSRFSSSSGKFPHDLLRGLNAPSAKLHPVHTAQQFDAQKLEQIEIKTITTDVTIKSDAGNDVQVELDGLMPGEHNEGLSAEVKNGVLTIETLEKSESRSGIHFDIEIDDDNSRKMVVHVPESWKKRLSITTISGDIIAHEDLTLRELNVATTSGNMDLDEVRVQNLHSKSVSGDLNFDGEAKKSQVASVSGSIELNYGNKVEKLDLESVSGDMQLSLVKSQGAIIDVTTLSGDIHTESPLEVTEKIARKYAHGKIGDGSATILVHSVSGDFHLDVED